MQWKKKKKKKKKEKNDWILYSPPDIGIMVRVLANGPRDLGSVPGRVILKTQKMVLDASLLNTQHYKVGSRVKRSNPGKVAAPSSTPQCSSYQKRSLRVTLDYGHHLYFYIFSTHSVWAGCDTRSILSGI